MRDLNERTARGSTQVGAIPPEMTDLDIIIASRTDKGADALVRELQAARGGVRQLWPIPERLP